MVQTILSLFDYSGSWSQPYRDNGYNVIQIDIKHGHDVMQFDPSPYLPVYGVLAAPPCTDFSTSGAQYWKRKDATGQTAKSLALVDRTLAIIEQVRPHFWALENPVGRLWSLRPQLKPFYFNPCDYGDPYTKRTGIAGDFVPPLPLFIGGDWSVAPTLGNIPIMKLGGKSERTKELRSITPSGFAKAFYLANQ